MASVEKTPGKLRLPVDDPMTDLPETAQRILVAAAHLLSERGYEAVTLENVAAEARVNKASIRYNFGNKAGLVGALVDFLIHDECLRLAADVRETPESERVHAATLGMRRMIVEADSFKWFFDILPHAYREPELRERLWSLYAWWFRQKLELFGFDSAANEENELLMGLAELLVAITDGLSVQSGLGQSEFDLGRPLAALELLLRSSMEQLAQEADA
jgi:AcrR family transcriptional regulator